MLSVQPIVHPDLVVCGDFINSGFCRDDTQITSGFYGTA
jgi:hypothetical protein